MGRTLLEMLDDDTGSTQVKTANDRSIESMALGLGLFGEDGIKTASEEKEEEEEEEKEEEGKEHKTAGFTGIEGLYESLFPDDVLGGIKTASEFEQYKEASYEEALGERTRDYHEFRLGQRLEKIAYNALHKGTVADHESDHPNHIDNNHGERNNGGRAIDLRPSIDNEIVPEHSDAIVGHEEWANGHNTIDNPKGVHMQKKAALRKAQILAVLEQ